MWRFSLDEVRSLVEGKFQWRQCITCGGKGWEWVDGDAGEVVSGPDPTRDIGDYYKDQCDNCNGLGGILRFL